MSAIRVVLTEDDGKWSYAVENPDPEGEPLAESSETYDTAQEAVEAAGEEESLQDVSWYAVADKESLFSSGTHVEGEPTNPSGEFETVDDEPDDKTTDEK